MRSVRASVLALTVAALLAVAGCGGGDDSSTKPQAPSSTSSGSFSVAPTVGTKPSPGPRPTVAELAAAVHAAKDPSTGKKYTSAAARCIAEALLDTDLSDGALNALEANIGTYTPSSADDKTFRTVLPKIAACSG